MDNKRCYLLVHQSLKRMPSPSCIITNHDAAFFPNMSVTNEVSIKVRKKLASISTVIICLLIIKVLFYVQIVDFRTARNKLFTLIAYYVMFLAGKLILTTVPYKFCFWSPLVLKWRMYLFLQVAMERCAKILTYGKVGILITLIIYTGTYVSIAILYCDGIL